MSGTFRAAVLLVAAAGTASAAVAAETLRLRPAGAVYADASGAGLREPEGVGCGPGGVLAVADTGNGRLVVYDVRDDTIVPRTSFALPELPYPVRVQVDSKGDLLALDGRLRKIGRVSADGAFRGYVDWSGAGGEVVPRSFRLDARGRVVVLDVRGGRVLFLEGGGKPVREIPFPEGIGFLSDLAIDAKGTVYLLDSVGSRVYAATADAKEAAPLDGSLRANLDFATSLEADGEGHLLVADQNGGGIVILGEDGAFRGRQSAEGWREGSLRYPSAIGLGAKGLLFVADRGNSRVQVFEISR